MQHSIAGEVFGGWQAAVIQGGSERKAAEYDQSIEALCEQTTKQQEALEKSVAIARQGKVDLQASQQAHAESESQCEANLEELKTVMATKTAEYEQSVAGLREQLRVAVEKSAERERAAEAAEMMCSEPPLIA